MKKRIISILMALVMALSLIPAGALAAGLPFTDVKTSDWFYNDVKNAYDKGLINGKTATTFEPDSNLTYAEAVKLAACMNQRNATGMVTLVNGNPWYATYVNYAKDNGIISKDYDWNAKATRAGYMEIFAKALPAANLKPINNVPDGVIPDVPMSHPQADAIYTLYRAGILQGSDAEHNCKPGDNIKRSEVAAILTRMMDVNERISFTMGEIPEELTITAQPQDISCAVGDIATFSVLAAGGKAPYKYQWQGYSTTARKYMSVVGGTSATLSFTVKEADFKDISKVRCVITDADGTQVTSNEAALIKIELEALTVTLQPQNMTCAVGDTAAFSVAAAGGKAPYKYQWQGYSTTARKYMNVVGGTSATLSFTVKEADFKDISKVRCVITDANGTQVTSNEATLTQVKVEAPTITAQPQDVTCAVGETATYIVAVSGGKAPYTYTWQWNPGTGYSNLGQYTFNYTEGLGTATLKIKNVSADALSWNGSFRCVITDANGNTVTSDEAKLVKKEIAPLKITTQPVNVTGKSGDSVSFTVVASGGKASYTYQWQVKDYYQDWENVNTSWIASAKSATLSFRVHQEEFENEYQYRCVVTDADGNKATSNAVKVIKVETTVPLTITTQPKDVACAVGDTATYTVAVSGGKAPYTYTWQWNPGTGYSNLGQYTFNYTEGLGTAILKIKNVSETALSWNGSFRCVITDADGNTVTSNEVKLTKTMTVTIKLEYDIMKAYVTGGVGSYTYKWTKDGSGNKVLGTGTSYRAVDNGTYTCTVTDSLGNTAKDSYRYAYYNH